mmetsp:Transcript_10277/g.12838  ORF Transcript_10277/g.12838 Transcript_10277/m.12838 type:complete len:82 (-) Transcript_10277:661-906(-)
MIILPSQKTISRILTQKTQMIRIINLRERMHSPLHLLLMILLTRKVNLREANLMETNLREENLRETNLREANLKGCRKRQE